MKKLLLILLCFISLNTLTYASFPITKSPTEQLSEYKTGASVSAKLLFRWIELHWAWKALIILFITIGVASVVAILWLIQQLQLQVL
jgi:hypothetical protein